MTEKTIALENAVKRCRERRIILPTYEQMRDPSRIPEKIREKLKGTGMQELDSMNLFRITWKNEPVDFGGGFGPVNHLELPMALTGVEARIIVLIGKYFPTGAHKVGATFGPLVEKLVTGRFDPSRQKALWPSTGNYCRGGAFNSRLLGCDSIAILPEGMSRERFEYLHLLGSEVIATPGTESNVKEIYDKVKELEFERGSSVVRLNQFEEIGNPLWHHAVTGPAMEEVFHSVADSQDRFSGVFLTQGSAGTLGCADYLRVVFPRLIVGAGEAIQCPTLLENGFGEHRIEGIGDKHVPWIHNIRNMDLVAGIDDRTTIRLMRLFNEPAGREYLNQELKIPKEIISRLPLLGISSIANLQGCIKMARYFEMNQHDLIFTVATDSMDMYRSRLSEENQQNGPFSSLDAAVSYETDLLGLKTDHMIEMNYREKKRMHNLKYFTWVEQQGKTVKELNQQWYDPDYWTSRYALADSWDERIREFNARTGVLENM